MNEDREYQVEVDGAMFRVIVHPDREDGGYWVECPDLPGCASQGNTVEEALEMIVDAACCYRAETSEKKPGEDR